MVECYLLQVFILVCWLFLLKNNDISKYFLICIDFVHEKCLNMLKDSILMIFVREIQENSVNSNVFVFQ
jgi:hypothetical protein